SLSSFILLFSIAPSTTDIFTLSLHDALPISNIMSPRLATASRRVSPAHGGTAMKTKEYVALAAMVALGLGSSAILVAAAPQIIRSEEHTSELQSRSDLVCRLLLEKKKKYKIT